MEKVSPLLFLHGRKTGCELAYITKGSEKHCVPREEFPLELRKKPPGDYVYIMKEAGLRENAA